MNTTKSAIATLATLLLCAHGTATAQKACRDYFTAGRDCMEKKKYEKARQYFNSSLNCDQTLAKDVAYNLDQIIQYVMQPPRPAATPTLEVGLDSLEMPHQGGEFEVRVWGAKQWQCISDSEWCQVSKHGNMVRITCDENALTSPLAATVTVADGKRKRTIRVTQAAAPDYLRCSTRSVNFPATGQTDYVDVQANVDWTVEGAPDWVTISRSRDRLLLAVDDNPGHSERTASVSVVSPGNPESTTTIHIRQGAGAETLATSKSDLVFGPDGGDAMVRVTTNANAWMLGDFPSWCQVSKVGADSLRVHCAPNDPINLAREGSVSVTTGLQSVGIAVSQEAKPTVYTIPPSSIGGRAVSLGVSAAYFLPIVTTGCDGDYTGSVVNYGIGGSTEQASYTSKSGFAIGALADVRLYRNFYVQAGLEFLQYKYKNELHSDDYRDLYSALPDSYINGKIQDNFTESYTFRALNLSVMASYRLPTSERSHLQFSAGPVLQYGLTAKMDFSGYSDGEALTAYRIVNGQKTREVDYSIIPLPRHIKGTGSMNLYGNHVDYTEHYVMQDADVQKSRDLDSEPLKRFNVGARLGVAYEYNGVSLGVEYLLMLTNMANARYWQGQRWTAFDNQSATTMSGYKHRNSGLMVKLAYTFRY